MITLIANHVCSALPTMLTNSRDAAIPSSRKERRAVRRHQSSGPLPHATDRCPFRKADHILAEIDPSVKVRFVDFHAELTSEKMAMGWYLNGRVSAVIGTHTHVPTADTRILSGGTAYQTDAGMTGPYNSVIGVDKDIILRRFLTAVGSRMEAARGGVELHSVIVDVDEATGKARSLKRYTIAEG